MLRMLLIVCAAGLLCYACATVPLTGRSQLSLVSNSEIVSMSATEYQQVVRQGPLSTDREQTELVRRVGTRTAQAVQKYMSQIGASSQLDGFKWEFNVIDDPKTVNAWCMPGGKVAFYTGILPICRDETGVAVVMGHEVAHAVANHGRERMSQQMVQQYGMTALGTLMGSNPGLGKQLFSQAVGIGSQLGMLSFSRTHESEADKIGLIFMAMAGYDPRQAVSFWQRMAAQGGQKQPEWLSTHPSDETRIRALQAQLPQALKYYKPGAGVSNTPIPSSTSSGASSPTVGPSGGIGPRGTPSSEPSSTPSSTPSKGSRRGGDM